MISASEMAGRIEHTLLRPEATPDQIDRLCDEVAQYGFAAVCVNPSNVRRVAARLETCGGSRTGGLRPAVVSVTGFPLGASATDTKVFEARHALDEGATQVDMVVALGALIAGEQDTVRRDIEAVARFVHGAIEGGILKVILETAAITVDRIMLGCRLCVESGADFVKTSTGFHPAGGATVEHVRMLRRWASPLRVKASGGIRTAGAACAMLEAGAAMLGTSSGVPIVEELRGAVA